VRLMIAIACNVTKYFASRVAEVMP
jgi:hypothetical protein